MRSKLFIAIACAVLGCTAEQDLGPTPRGCAQSPGRLVVDDDGSILAEGVPPGCGDVVTDASLDACSDDDESTLCLNPYQSNNDASAEAPDALEPDPTGCPDPDGDGHIARDAGCERAALPWLGVDCDESSAWIHESSAEGCDGIDQDCDDRIDEGRTCDATVELIPHDDVAGPGFVDVAIDEQSNVYAVGHDGGWAVDGGDAPTMRIVSADASGTTRWEHRLAFELSADWFVHVDGAIAVRDGRVYVFVNAPQLERPDGTPIQETDHHCVLAFDAATGDVLWVTPLAWEHFGDSGVGAPSVGLAVTSDAVLLAATVKVDDDNFGMLRYARLDLDGALEWERTTERRAPQAHPSEQISTSAFAAIEGGEMLIAGTQYTAIAQWDDCDLEAFADFIARIDAEGRCVWSATMPNIVDTLSSLPDGGFVLGTTLGATKAIGGMQVEVDETRLSSEATLAARFDAEGNALWIHSYEHGALHDGIHDLSVAADGSIYAALGLGQFVGNADAVVDGSGGALQYAGLGVVSKLSADGDEEWSRDVDYFDALPSSVLEGIDVAPNGDVVAISAGRLTWIRP